MKEAERVAVPEERVKFNTRKPEWLPLRSALGVLDQFLHFYHVSKSFTLAEMQGKNRFLVKIIV